ncbi:hypothetical protein LCGC14_1263470 [marine sediment metagenome]|uniref:Uncharacterized protein n=1 Tax=marine sediment metagenome TaxID=412755 RepID=A0A0F9LLE6_9ZZZZ
MGLSCVDNSIPKNVFAIKNGINLLLNPLQEKEIVMNVII